ncbi:MAG TPA: hypothetical protein VN636_20385 [Acidimicrobiia bacterium]|nr:hypothetical protein [Acidimicrobiia bacterium]
MAIVYRTLPSLGCTVSVWDGDVSDKDVREHLIRLAGDPDWPPGNLNFTDLTSVRAARIPDPELVELLYEETNLAAELKVAVLMPGDDRLGPQLDYGTAPQSLATVTFTDFAAACAFLDVPEEPIRTTISRLRRQLAATRAD